MQDNIDKANKPNAIIANEIPFGFIWKLSVPNKSPTAPVLIVKTYFSCFSSESKSAFCNSGQYSLSQ